MRDRPKSALILASERKSPIRAKDVSPGPSAYVYKKPYNATGVTQFVGKPKEKRNDESTPGPGAYNAMDTSTTMKARPRSAMFRKAKRFKDSETSKKG